MRQTFCLRQGCRGRPGRAPLAPLAAVSSCGCERFRVRHTEFKRWLCAKPLPATCHGKRIMMQPFTHVASHCSAVQWGAAAGLDHNINASIHLASCTMQPLRDGLFCQPLELGAWLIGLTSFISSISGLKGLMFLSSNASLLSFQHRVACSASLCKWLDMLVS